MPSQLQTSVEGQASSDVHSSGKRQTVDPFAALSHVPPHEVSPLEQTSPEAEQPASAAGSQLVGWGVDGAHVVAVAR
jgi:hypothetical protein